MPWLQLRVNSSREQSDAVENAMMAHGALSVTLEDNADQPIFEPALGETPLWQETRVTGLFEADIDSQTTLNNIEQSVGTAIPSSQWQLLEDKDWEREWMTHYHPIQCGESFWICPSWISPPDPQATNLMLDPGLAFGTGTHPTTFLCMQWIAQQDFAEKTVIDYGCGSGILGIGALLLGAPQVVGIDIDPQALVATQDNVARNQLATESFPVYFPSGSPQESADFVLANILAGPLVELAPQLVNLLNSGGQLCLSGILDVQKDDIVNAYSPLVEIVEIRQKDEWVCITAKKTK